MNKPSCQYSSDFIHSKLATCDLKPDARPATMSDDITEKSSFTLPEPTRLPLASTEVPLASEERAKRSSH